MSKVSCSLVFRCCEKSILISDERSDVFKAHDRSIVSNMLSFYETSNELVDAVLSHENVQKLLKSEDKFDVCFIDSSHANGLLVRFLIL
jgi:hypothetical protein